MCVHACVCVNVCGVMCVCVCVWGRVGGGHVHAHAHIHAQVPLEARTGFQELKLQMVLPHMVLGTKVGSSRRAQVVLNTGPSLQAHTGYFKTMINMTY